MKRLALLSLAASLLTPGIACADNWNVAVKVTMVEASHVPRVLYFQVDRQVGNCAAGTYLAWNPEGDTDVQKAANLQSIYATLLTAKITKQTVRISGDSSGCTGNLLYVEQ